MSPLVYIMVFSSKFEMLNFCRIYICLKLSINFYILVQKLKVDVINFAAFTNHKLLIKTTTRSIHREVSIKKPALKIFAILTGKLLCWNLFLIKLQAWRSEEHVFLNKTAWQVLPLPFMKEMMYIQIYIFELSYVFHEKFHTIWRKAYLFKPIEK